MILKFFLIFKTITGQLPSNCGCYLADDPTDAAGCSTRGCSVGNNIFCNNYFDTSPYRYATLADTSQSATDYASYRGCNCPGSTSTATHNGYYGTSTNHYGYSYTNCTDYGGNARNTDGHIPADIDTATDCCNFCCNRNDSYPSSLPPECYNPDGTSCEWYKNCLEKKYPCQGDPDDYAMKYATNYCNRYTENYKNFSEAGRKWVDAVRKCLQITLTPLLNQSSVDITCEKIKNDAFAFHGPCYAVPNAPSLTPSYCDLGWSDKKEAFFTVWKALLPPTFWKTVLGVLEVDSRCDDRAFFIKYNASIRKLRIYGQQIIYIPVSEDDIGKGIGIMEVWDPERLQYYVYSDTPTGRAKTNEQNIVIQMLIFDKFALDNMDNITIANDSQHYLDKTIDHLFQSVEQGKLKIETTNGTFYVKQTDRCLDINCNETDGSPAIAPPYNFVSRSVNSNICIIIVLVCVLLSKNDY